MIANIKPPDKHNKPPVFVILSAEIRTDWQLCKYEETSLIWIDKIGYFMGCCGCGCGCGCLAVFFFSFYFSFSYAYLIC